MFDRDRTGTINMQEFGDLFNYINQWKGVFEGIDRDRSGFIEFHELTTGQYQVHALLTLPSSLVNCRYL